MDQIEIYSSLSRAIEQAKVRCPDNGISVDKIKETVSHFFHSLNTDKEIWNELSSPSNHYGFDSPPAKFCVGLLLSYYSDRLLLHIGAVQRDQIAPFFDSCPFDGDDLAAYLDASELEFVKISIPTADLEAWVGLPYPNRIAEHDTAG